MITDNFIGRNDFKTFNLLPNQGLEIFSYGSFDIDVKLYQGGVLQNSGRETFYMHYMTDAFYDPYVKEITVSNQSSEVFYSIKDNDYDFLGWDKDLNFVRKNVLQVQISSITQMTAKDVINSDIFVTTDASPGIDIYLRFPPASELKSTGMFSANEKFFELLIVNESTANALFLIPTQNSTLYGSEVVFPQESGSNKNCALLDIGFLGDNNFVYLRKA